MNCNHVNSTLAEQNRCIIVEGELQALKHTVVELEAKLLQVQTILTKS